MCPLYAEPCIRVFSSISSFNPHETFYEMRCQHFMNENLRNLFSQQVLMLKNGCLYISSAVCILLSTVRFCKVLSSARSRAILMKNMEFGVNQNDTFICVTSKVWILHTVMGTQFMTGTQGYVAEQAQTGVEQKDEFVRKPQIVSLNVVNSKESVSVFDPVSTNLSVRKPQHLCCAGEIVDCHNWFGKQFGTTK